MGSPVIRGLRAIARYASGEAGLTLPELLVSMAILGTVLTGVVTVFAAGTRAQTDRDVRFRAQVQLNTALGKLRREAHNACEVAPGFTTSSITLNMPATTPPQPPDTPCTAGLTTPVTWCATTQSGRIGLFRVAGSTCTTTGAKKYADYLTTSAVFPAPTYTQWSNDSGTLARLSVRFSVDERPGDSTRAYTIFDVIVLRNSVAAAQA